MTHLHISPSAWLPLPIDQLRPSPTVWRATITTRAQHSDCARHHHTPIMMITIPFSQTAYICDHQKLGWSNTHNGDRWRGSGCPRDRTVRFLIPPVGRATIYAVGSTSLIGTATILDRAPAARLRKPINAIEYTKDNYIA